MPTPFRCSFPGYYFYRFLSTRQYLTMDLCILCEESLNDGRLTISLRQKGCDGVNEASKKRGISIRALPGQTVHQDCRRNHCNPRRINSAQVNVTENTSKRRALRSEATPFDYKEHCLFCGQSAKYEGKKKGYDVIPVRTGDFQTRIHERCKRRHDKWAQGSLKAV